jgi:hypothetical protein
MPFADVKLKPGISVDWTPTLNEAAYSQSQLIRFRDQLAQKYGGWVKFYPFAVSGIPRELHAWQDLNGVNHLAVGTTTQFAVVTGGALSAITPQQLVSNFAPNFSTVINTATVTIVDPNISNVTTFDSVFFDTPVSIGGIILSGLYPIVQVTGVHSYQITAKSNATATVNNAGTVPAFTTTSSSAVVSVLLANHGLSVGSEVAFSIPTTGNGVTISGALPATVITDANNFQIQVPTLATANGSFSMNSGQARLVYYISLGPPAAGVGYGLGGYGLGGYGTGVVPSAQTGTPINATDWTIDNWGQLVVACPAGGAIYYYDPTGGFLNMSLVSAGPPFNSGIFVSTTEQILVAYGSSDDETTNDPLGIGVLQDPMLVQWSDTEDFLDWTPTDQNFAGNFRIPIGSKIMAGVAGSSNQNLIWTDLDLWAMNFIGQPDVFGWNQIGAGAGACGRHVVQKMRGSLYWMGLSNFYVYDGSGVSVLPCPVWDAVFQNLNVAFAMNARAMPNTPFNEVGWFYPSLASTSGENDSYVKMNITEPGQPWDIGTLARSAWIDLTILGNPIAATPTGVIYQHETGQDADGQPLVWSFTTGYFQIDPGDELAQVDQFIPDFKWGTYAGASSAQVMITFLVVDFPGQTPRQYGPYTMQQATDYLWVRFRGRQVALQIGGADLGSFVRLGRCRFRYRKSGRAGTFAP